MINVREEALKVIANTREVVVDRIGVDVVTHEHCEKTNGFRSRVMGMLMQAVKGNVRIHRRVVSHVDGVIDSGIESNSMFTDQVVQSPW